MASVAGKPLRTRTTSTTKSSSVKIFFEQRKYLTKRFFYQATTLMASAAEKSSRTRTTSTTGSYTGSKGHGKRSGKTNRSHKSLAGRTTGDKSPLILTNGDFSIIFFLVSFCRMPGSCTRAAGALTARPGWDTTRPRTKSWRSI